MSELIDNRAHRIGQLKRIIRHLHEGRSAGEVRAELASLVGATDYSEIVAMEQELIADGMPVEEIASMCDLHSQVTRDVLVQLQPAADPPGHPAHQFLRENAALREVVSGMRRTFTDLESGQAAILRLRELCNQLADIEKHYARKENAFFPMLEKHGITGPSKVMWAKDDEVRVMLKDFSGALMEGSAAQDEWKLLTSTLGQSLTGAVEEMIYKEENILLPMCRNAFTEEEWAEIWHSSPRYGWCLVEPLEGYRPAEPVAKEGIRLGGGQTVQFDTGALSFAQLESLFRTLPVDLTLVDADDRVAFFSEGPDRVFARSRAVVGRKVQNCHPPRSVEVVDRILSDFRAGTHNVAEFWINFHSRFVHIRYFALRDPDGVYLGTLEVTQDATHLRGLQGERRLLEYGGAETAGASQ